MGKRLPTWEQLNAAIPTSLLEAEARILHLQGELASIDEQITDPLPIDERDSGYKVWLASAMAARRQKNYQLRRLRIWVQDHNAKVNKARKLNQFEESLTERITARNVDPEEAEFLARRQELRDAVNRMVKDDLIIMGTALKHVSKVWGVLINVLTAAKAYVDVESSETATEDEVQEVFDMLTAALDEVERKGYMPGATLFGE